uniref:Glutamate--tRNA ligase n=1 Tax=uncultured bacterium contig00037 TaxID=1181525 RepID=A0A806KFZ1_9BACT|nr:glutamyl-tRNA synthetase @ glutamyl-tRNA(Gln) synthetase [uncultured bacterium contig00037]
MKIRDRYAPSPTGLQHIGGIRTALFNYLFAHAVEDGGSAGGKFILRLEDTDRTRSEDCYVQNLYDTFAWLGIKWDEGPDVGGPFAPYVQSERSGLYKKYAQELLDKDRAYYCFCTPERIEKVRLDREAAKSSETGYDRFCRNIDPQEAARRAAAGEACTVRLKIPLGGTTLFQDHLLGDIEWKNDDVNPDPVLLKSDGFPTYHLANVVDDHLMEITHVLRAQEWLSSTPLHVIMYKSFGWAPPEFCHLPMVMGQDGKKLSKRHGATSIDEFRKQGYLPEALLNYVALLGASYEEGKELYTLDELARRFSLDKLNKAPAVFDYKKLEWYNGQYIRMKSDEELARLCLPYAIEANLFKDEPTVEQRKVFVASMALVKERLVFLGEVPEKIAYLFKEPEVAAAEEFIPKKCDLAGTVGLLRHALEFVKPLAEMPDDGQAENFIKSEAEKHGVKLGDLMMPLRVAITGSRVSPPLFGSLRILGAECSLARVKRALEKISITEQ